MKGWIKGWIQRYVTENLFPRQYLEIALVASKGYCPTLALDLPTYTHIHMLYNYLTYSCLPFLINSKNKSTV